MTLADFFAAIGPVLEGRTPYDPQALYRGEAGRERDAARVGIYARFCRIHRFEVVDDVYAYCRREVVRAGGEQAWEELVESFFRAHPMRHVELCENGGPLPEFLAERAAAGRVPAWLPELADLEWWEWRTRVAPDAPEDGDPRAGPLRIASTVELRPYRYDLVGFLDDQPADARPMAPPASAGVVIFWRDRDLEPRRERATPIELVALKLISEGVELADGARRMGAPLAELEETTRDLVRADIVLGPS